MAPTMTKAGLLQSSLQKWIYKFESLSLPQQRATLAVLRHGLGRNLTECPEIWGLIMEILPDSLIREKGGPTFAEKAAFYALTLYAMAKHIPETKEDISLGKAAAILVRTEAETEHREIRVEKNPIYNRIQRIVASGTLEEMIVPVKSLVQLLDQKKVKLNFPRLARDLYETQFPDGNIKINASWARDYFYNLRPQSASNKS